VLCSRMASACARSLLPRHSRLTAGIAKHARNADAAAQRARLRTPQSAMTVTTPACELDSHVGIVSAARYTAADLLIALGANADQGLSTEESSGGRRAAVPTRCPLTRPVSSQCAGTNCAPRCWRCC
jgi:hypothetical protein